MAGMYCLKDLLNLVEREGAEELSLEPGKPPVMSVAGRIRMLPLPVLTGEEVAELFRSFAAAEHLEEIRQCGNVHFNFSFQGSARFKVTASMKGEEMSLKLRQLGR